MRGRWVRGRRWNLQCGCTLSGTHVLFVLFGRRGCVHAVQAVQTYCVDIKPGDVIITGTDGLLDNVFNDRSAKLVWDAKSRGATPGVAAQQLAVLASARALDPLYQSPFAKAAMKSGFFYRGGKVDDITVVISYVLPGEAPAAGAGEPVAESDAEATQPSAADSGDSGASVATTAVAGAAAASGGNGESAAAEAPAMVEATPHAAVGGAGPADGETTK